LRPLIGDDSLFSMLTPTSRCALAVAGLILGSAQVALGQTADTIKKIEAQI
jgi:hypothetical protein